MRTRGRDGAVFGGGPPTTYRRLCWRVHGWLGLAAGAFVLVVTVTGAVLPWHDDLDRLAHPRLVRSLDRLAPGARRPDLRDVVAAAERARPGLAIDAIVLPTRPDDAVLVTGYRAGPRGPTYRLSYVDAGTGRPLGERASDGTLGGWLLALHYQLLLGDWGETFLLVVALALVASSMTGLVVTRRWWRPGAWVPWRPRGTRPPHAAGAGAPRPMPRRAWLGAWHRALGLWSLLATLVLGASGAWLNRFGLQRLRAAAGAPPPVAPASPTQDRRLSLSALVAAAPAVLPGLRPRYLVLPHASGDPILVQGRPPGPLPLWSDAGGGVRFDAATGRVLGVDDVRRAGPGARLDDLASGAHFGRWGGWPVHLLYTLAGLTIAAVTASGGLVWLARARQAGGSRAAGRSRPPGPPTAPRLPHAYDPVLTFNADLPLKSTWRTF